MNRTDTIKHIALSADLSRYAAGRVMEVFEARLKRRTPAIGETALCDEIAAGAQISPAAAGRAVHQINGHRGKMLLTQESAWI